MHDEDENAADDSSYDDLFDSVAAEMDGSAADSDDLDADDEGSADDLGDQGDNDEQDDEGAGADAGDDDHQGTDAAQPAPQGQATDDLETLRAENQKLQHQLRSEAGRQAAYQRKVAEYEQRLAQQQAATQAAPTGVSDDQWNEILEDYPEIATAFDSRLNAAIGRIEGTLHQRLQPFEQQAQEKHIADSQAALSSRHPDWQEVNAAPEFHSWLNTAPEAMRQLYGSMSVEDNAFLLDTFKAQTGFGHARATANADASASLRQKRQAQLAGAVSQPRRGGAPRDPNAGSYNSAFDEAARKLDARR